MFKFKSPLSEWIGHRQKGCKMLLKLVFLAITMTFLAPSAARAKAKNELTAKQQKELEANCQKKQAEACLSLADHLLKENKITEARAAWTTACEIGIFAACLQTINYDLSDGQIQKALRTAQTACAVTKDKGEACFVLAQIAEDHGGGEQALLWYKKSCQLGSAEACKKTTHP